MPVSDHLFKSKRSKNGMKKLAIRTALAALIFVAGTTSYATAKPHRHYHASVRHFAHQHHAHRHLHRTAGRKYENTRSLFGGFWQEMHEARDGVVGGLIRQFGGRYDYGRSGQVIGGRPSGCPHAFCGCALSIKLFGHQVPGLNLAANWLRFPRTSPAPGMVAARPGHVWQIIGPGSRQGYYIGWDANSGGGRIRIHERSIAGFTIVNPHGHAYANRKSPPNA
jgi:hypothetical protein